MNPTLFEKIGGQETVEKASHFLYVHILQDEHIKHFFKDIDIETQQRKMSAFLTYIFGGPSLYIGKDMRRAHKNAVGDGLGDSHVDSMMECVRKALSDVQVDEESIEEVIKTIETHRDDVLGR